VAARFDKLLAREVMVPAARSRQNGRHRSYRQGDRRRRGLMLRSARSRGLPEKSGHPNMRRGVPYTFLPDEETTS
jgi:hypothetical protein